ncbi:hypothetical protein THMIRHAS_01250 [Thiosulfatimonas sediminis]|uniref:Uncharacterized protein n=1 Tax=Thiosulfatimonas sediminis TaxID=2675054 RepID=A0A6F8PRJ5_9GAMM|nr:hypothetical protein [Thiosulfatimonas sediminis]BBP44752.1 hypothetical protein THMIRHAS_01250 [Thiosulfatimonas sediminis]
MPDKNHSTLASHHDVLEAEVLSEAPDEPSQRDKKPTQSPTESRIKSQVKQWLTHLKERIVSSALVLLLIIALVYLFAQQQWMQNRFVNLDQDIQTLDKNIQKASQQAQNVQSEVQGITSHDYEQQLEQQNAALQTLQTQLKAMAEQPMVNAQQLQALEQKLSQQIQQATSGQAASSDGEALSQLKNTLQQQINAIQQAQQQLTAQFKQGQAKQGPANTLSLEELQYWALKINTQWLLQAPIEQTLQQLLAFKQAVGLLPKTLNYSITLLVDQDIAQLKQRAAQSAQRPVVDLSQLRQRVKTLPQQTIDKAESTPEVEPVGGLWQGLLDKLSSLVKIQKREAESVTEVEALMLREVIQQRLLMEIDRLEYALQVESPALVRAATERLNQLAKAQAPAIASAFSSDLLPFAQWQALQRKPLLVSKIADAAQS